MCRICVISSFINYNLRYCTITNICQYRGVMILPISRCLDQCLKEANWSGSWGNQYVCSNNKAHELAFSPKSAYTMAYCPACFEKWRQDGKRERRQRGEGERQKRWSNKQEDCLLEHVGTTCLEIWGNWPPKKIEIFGVCKETHSRGPVCCQNLLGLWCVVLV